MNLPQPNPSEKQDIDALTGLRFFAAFYVFLFHMQIRWPMTRIPFLKNILEQGAIGMSLFFMLSGFVLAFRYTNSGVSYKSFLINRFARIYPTYALLALLTLPWIGTGWNETTNFHAQLLAALKTGILVIANIFILQGWFPQMFAHWNDGGAWSISVEAFCYILCPLILVKISPLSTKQIGFTTLTCYFLSAMTGLVAICFFLNPVNSIFYSLPIYRLPEFTIGICAYMAYSRNVWKTKSNYYLYAIIAFFLFYLAKMGPKFPVYISHNWIVIPSIGFAILNAAYGQSLFARLLSLSPMVWLGKISYSFYCFQALMVLLLIDYHDKLTNAVPPLANNHILCLAAFAVLTLVSGLSYTFIESPARRKIKAHFQ